MADCTCLEGGPCKAFDHKSVPTNIGRDLNTKSIVYDTPITSQAALVDHLATGCQYMGYKGPMDNHICLVRVKRYTVNIEWPNKSTITFTYNRSTYTVKINEHLSRITIKSQETK